MGGSAGDLRCGKGTTWDGGMHVAGIAWYSTLHWHHHNMSDTHSLTLTLSCYAAMVAPTVVHAGGLAKESVPAVSLTTWAPSWTCSPQSSPWQASTFPRTAPTMDVRMATCVVRIS